MTPMKILIVDDESHLRTLIQQTLEELEDDGVELLTATNGEEALETIRAEEPNLVFLDVMMPKKNGFDVCNAVKNELGMSHIHIILLTAKGQEFDRQRGQEVGADLYMTKPFDPDALVAKARSDSRSLRVRSLRHMAAVTLKSLLRPTSGSAPVVAALLKAVGAGVGIIDAQGKLLMGNAVESASPGDARVAIDFEGAPLGYVLGPPETAQATALLLAHLAARESEGRALAAEVLHLYREVHLIEQLSEQLVALLNSTAVAESALGQAQRLISATHGSVLVLEKAGRQSRARGLLRRRRRNDPIRWDRTRALPHPSSSAALERSSTAALPIRALSTPSACSTL